jgi:ferredoxin-NADP reductase
MDAQYISNIVPAFKDADVFICGPAPLVDAVRKAAEDSGIPKNRFHDEAFAFHGE